MASNTVSPGWDFQTKHVQDLGVFKGADYISSESIVMCAVPWAGTAPDLSPSTTVADWIPIGLLENITIQQNKQLQSMYEIGSKKMFNIPGRTYKRINLSRIMFNGPSIMKAISQFNLPYAGFTGTINAIAGHDGLGAAGGLDEPAAGVNPTITAFNYNETAVGAANNTSHLFIDLASSFFNSPVNLGMVFRDSEDDTYGAFILSDAFVQSHQMTITGQQTVVMENISMTCGDLIPVTAG